MAEKPLCTHNDLPGWCTECRFEESTRYLESQIQSLQAENAELKAELKKYREAADKSICTYCGHLRPKNAEAMLEHMIVCEKHPTMKMVEKLNGLLVEYDALKKLAAGMAEAIQKFSEDCKVGLVMVPISIDKLRKSLAAYKAFNNSGKTK